MLKRSVSSKEAYDKPTTIICKDTIIETTKLKSKSSVQISGEFIGDIETISSLVVGETGKVKGNIKAAFVLVAGEVNGCVEVQHQLQLTSTGKIIGDITCESLIVDDGAVIEGACKMKKIDSGKEKPAKVNMDSK